jgi:alkanesulfonate monooxygenase SsuD/methylene tetrahydromethanopterin reductase-like flavin-dependent oxidoreductase (luciferase family)
MRLAAFLDPGRSLEEATERVRLAESLGYDSAWVTHIASREPLQVLGHYAHATTRIGLGTGVVPFMLRHPALLGMEAATLDEISGGRLRLGIGVSHKVTIEGWYGLTLDDPVGRTSEYTRILRQVFQQDGGEFEGRHYVSRFGFLGYGARRDLPILWAAMGPRMLRAAAELADGIVLWMCSPRHIRETIRPVLDAALAEHGRPPEEFEVVAAVPSAVTEDLDAARGAFRSQAFPYLNLPFYRKEVAAVHPDALATFDHKMAGGDMPGALAAMDDRFVDEYAGVGSAAAVRAKVEEYRAAGVTLPALGVLGRRVGAGVVEATLEAAIGSA